MKKIIFIVLAATLLAGCDLFDSSNPSTKERMQGNWVLTQATDAQGVDITNKLNFPITAIQLTDDNGMLGSMAPMFTYIVYGGSNWVEASAKIKQAFDYYNLRFNTGEFFVGDGDVDNFTVEAKLQATAVDGGLTDILEVFGVNTSWLQKTVYHKFMDVGVEFMDNDNTMIWTFDNYTVAAYNYKDSKGNIVLWGGWPTNNFQKCKFVFAKKASTLNDLVKNAY